MKIIFKIISNQYLWLILIVILGLYVRLYKIDSTVADWHAWRQADTAAVTRIFYQEGLNLFEPKYFDMSDISGAGINLERYRYVEFPIYNSISYFVMEVAGEFNIKYLRLVSVAMSLGSTVLLYFITKRYWGTVTALLSSFIFALLPYNVFYSRTVLPEPTLVFFCLGMFYFVDLWISKNSLKLYFLTVFFTAMAFLVKPFAVFYTLPLIYKLFLEEQSDFKHFIKRLCLWLIPSLTPFLLWRIWISRHPEGIPASGWLFNGNHIRFRPAFWRWIVADRLDREMLSATGFFLFLFGLITRPKDKHAVMPYLLALSLLLYLVVVATGNVQHDYYQVLIVPVLAMFVARGFVTLISGNLGLISRIWTIPLALFLFGLMFYLSWLEVKGLYQINNNSIVIAGEAADKILPKNSIVIAPWDGDTAFLYQVNRPGFPMVYLPIEEMIAKYNTNYYISVNYDAQTNQIMQKYKIMEQNPKFVIIDLGKPIN